MSTTIVNYKPPLKDIEFQLEAFDYSEVAGLDLFKDEDGDAMYDLESAVGVLTEASDLLVEKWLPTNRIGDIEGVHYHPEDNSVTTPECFKEAYNEYAESGYMSLGYPQEYEGGGAPHMLALMLGEVQIACNKSLSMCPGLSHGLISTLKAYGSQEQKDTWLPKLVTGEWAGTMCLTEPQAGTDLGILYTAAKPAGEVIGEETVRFRRGREKVEETIPVHSAYKLTGQKIWITFGEHDLTENIVHLVLARLPGAPEGTDGISTFIVPKFKLDGTRNGIYCTGADHKMGINGSPTCVISMEDAEGYLVGQPHKGMRAMFVMMNEARLSVGLEGLALSEASYQAALDFAKERRQGRSLNRSRNEAGEEADCILVHPDVRRLLLRVRSTTEAMRGIGCFVAKHIDLSHGHPDPKQREYSDDLVAILTPVVKSFFTDVGFQNTSDAMQVCGGIGYTTEWPIEQYMRDMRIALIYEGTNHIQALDLVGRKLLMPKNAPGRLIRNFQKEYKKLLAESEGEERLAEFIKPAKKAMADLEQLTMMLAMKGMKDRELVAAVASEYLNVFGYTTFAFSWLWQCKFALQKGDDYAQTKLKLARFFFQQVFPAIDVHKQAALNGKDSMMDFDESEF
ncbi:MAG: acyl-CoA dehydrogenase [Myxococcota bacterium]|nr:acyl-CoA dehydrogenase [Myxococcota bacterium]